MSFPFISLSFSLPLFFSISISLVSTTLDFELKMLLAQSSVILCVFFVREKRHSRNKIEKNRIGSSHLSRPSSFSSRIVYRTIGGDYGSFAWDDIPFFLLLAGVLFDASRILSTFRAAFRRGNVQICIISRNVYTGKFRLLFLVSSALLHKRTRCYLLCWMVFCVFIFIFKGNSIEDH